MKTIKPRTGHSALRYYSAQFIFWIHAVLSVLPVLLFFIPSSIWPHRIEWHFVYNALIFSQYFIWGSIWTFSKRDKVYSVCFVTTLTQSIRGYKLFDKKNYEHSFVKELLAKLDIHTSPGAITKAMALALFISLVFLVLKLCFGIVLY